MNAHALSPHPTGDAPDDPPPAYSPGPDHYVGESTVEHGPYRPFRAAPPPVQHLAAHVDDAGEVAYVDARHGGSPGVWTPGGRPTLPPPPPRHPSSPGRILSPTRARPLSDFAADFFAAGTGEPPSSSGAGSDSLYAPPSGPPPERPMLGPSHHRSASQGAQSSSSSYFPTNGLPGSDTPDDGRPTRIPVPGHPLLNAGRILVYPAGHECHKCQNTGYKNEDPTRPCNRCWSRFARPYEGVITYAPAPSREPPRAPFTAGTKTFQRPLAHFVPPHVPAGGDAKWGRSLSVSGRGPSAPPATPAPTPMSMSMGHAPWQPAPGTSPFGGPPPGAVVVSPGDARIGGMPCWRCGGSGVARFL